MKKTLSYLLSIVILLGIPAIAPAQDIVLPKTTILGQEFYYYDVDDKDQTPYAICQRFHWNMDTLQNYNKAVLADMHKGNRIFYPLPVEKLQNHVISSEFFDNGDESEIFEHLVNRGETIYGLSKMYEITPDDIYALNPDTHHGLRAGETIKIPMKGDIRFVRVAPGTVITEISNKYNTTVQDILKENPGVTPNHLRSGTVIRVPRGSALNNTKEIEVNSLRVRAFGVYKAEKDDSWNGIARSFSGVTLEALREANTGIILRKNSYVSIPLTEETTDIIVEIAEDPREATFDGRNEIYKEVNSAMVDTSAPVAEVNDDTVDETVQDPEEVTIAIVLEDPSSTKDQEFMLGFLENLDKIKDGSIKVDLRVINGAESSDYDNIPQLQSLDLIISTYEKEFPQKLASFANRQRVAILNVFDVKSEIFIDNPAVANLLAPSNYFNDAITEYACDNFGDRQVVVIGKIDPDDVLSNGIISGMTTAPITLSTEEMADYDFRDGQDYLFYVISTGRSDFSKSLSAIAQMIGKCTSSQVNTFCRPNHVVYAESLRDKLTHANALIPSRVFFSNDDYDSTQFLAHFKDLYGRNPANTFPNYAAMGYDVADYFIPAIAFNDGDFNFGFPIHTSSLQSDFDLIRISNWSGFINPLSYILQFAPGSIIKHKVK